MTEADVTESNAKIKIEIPDENRYDILINDWFKVSGILGDITHEQVDAITNAANYKLGHGKGVAGAISKKGGP